MGIIVSNTTFLHAAGVNETGRGPLGLIGGNGGILDGEDLDCILTSTGDPGITDILFSPATKVECGGKNTRIQLKKPTSA